MGEDICGPAGGLSACDGGALFLGRFGLVFWSEALFRFFCGSSNVPLVLLLVFAAGFRNSLFSFAEMSVQCEVNRCVLTTRVLSLSHLLL